MTAIWTDDVQRYIITEWGEAKVSNQLQGNRRDSVFYKRMVNDVHRLFNVQLTLGQLTSRLKYLRRLYAAAKDNINNKGKSGDGGISRARHFPFYELLDAILGDQALPSHMDARDTRRPESVALVEPKREDKLGQKCLSFDTNSIILRQAVKSIIPPLMYAKHKGQDGRLATIGGCQEYTGAPYFAAISALKIGCDLSHVFCTKDAAPVIKSYSPELIVHPVLDKDDGVEELSNNWLPRMHSLIIGPGLGRHPSLLENTKVIISKAKELNIPLVIDADGVYLLSQHPEVIYGYKKAILTPNIMEFKLLYKKVLGEEPDLREVVDSTVKLSQSLGNVTIVNKGAYDIITDGNKVLINSSEGSPRRCGGQGDLLSGSMGTMTFWAHNFYRNKDLDDDVYQFGGPTMIAAYGASLLTRMCANLAFAKKQRSMTTMDMIAEICDAFKNLFE